MKKIFRSVICLLLAMFMLVSCGDEDIGDYITNYDKPESKERLNYNLYIICDDQTSENAKTTVKLRINDYTKDSALQTALNVVYCTASEYEAKILNKELDGTKDQADIFLVTSEALMDKLLADERLADLTEYMNGDYEYSKFNAQIASSLLKASLISEKDETGSTVMKNYCVPNNYVVGSYKYLTINTQKAALHLMSELDLQQNEAGYIGTEYFWVLLSEYFGDDVDHFEFIKEKGSYIEDPNLLTSRYECTLVSTPTKDDNKYTYFLIGTDAAAKYNIDYSEIDTIVEARNEYLNNNVDKSKNLSKDKFDEVFKELKVEKAFSSEDLDLIKNKSKDYFNQIKNPEVETASVGDEYYPYTYIFFDKEKADFFGLGDNSYFKNCGLIKDNNVITLWNKIKEKGENPADYIKIVSGSINDKQVLENKGYICNIPELPSATRADAFSAAFAVNANVVNVERAMEVIYAINNDSTLHNYLQYGIPDTHYSFVGEREDGIIVRSNVESTRYYMNPRYTGNIFGILYCEDIGTDADGNKISWMEEDVDSAKKQNDASVYKP